MSITFNEKDKLFTLTTKNSTYQLRAAEYGFLTHVYYGGRVDGQDLGYLYVRADRGFSGNPAEALGNRGFSLDTLPLEYPTSGVGDYRVRALEVIHSDGANALSPRYAGYAIKRGKYAIDGLPAFFEEYAGEAETLEIYLTDNVSNVDITLLYGVFEDKDFITRAAVVTNKGENAVKIPRIASFSLDFPYGDFDVLHFYGRHAMEREPQRTAVMRGVMSIRSERGASSLHHNPGFILCEKDAGEFNGECYGVNLVYSGSFEANIERDQIGQTRINAGMFGNTFTLGKNQSVHTPEAVLTYSPSGLSGISANFHKMIRNNLQKGKFVREKRPVIINNWEATYFDFTGAKLIGIAKAAKDIGADTFVMDDGWFGERNDDKRGLGDWNVNEAKLGMTLKELAAEVNEAGLNFGIWFEPEMVNQDSRLYEARPDWALRLPGREPTTSRQQLVLDMSRKDVVDYLFGVFAGILRSANITYVKWDMNRSVSDWYSAVLTPDEQAELPHRFILGVYDLLGRLTTAFPDVLFEGCSGGGGRFDLGMLYYCPHIWCSDNTDPISRLKIQYGTSFLYPLSAMAAHVSVSPNHQTGRVTPIETRGLVALTGAFGFELDVEKMSESEKKAALAVTEMYNRHHKLISDGVYYRLAAPYSAETCSSAVWQFVSEDGAESLVCVVATDTSANSPPSRIRLKGLDESAMYRCERKTCVNGALYAEESTYSGAALARGGIASQGPYGHYPSVSFYFEKINEKV